MELSRSALEFSPPKVGAEAAAPKSAAILKPPYLPSSSLSSAVVAATPADNATSVGSTGLKRPRCAMSSGASGMRRVRSEAKVMSFFMTGGAETGARVVKNAMAMLNPELWAKQLAARDAAAFNGADSASRIEGDSVTPSASISTSSSSVVTSSSSSAPVTLLARCSLPAAGGSVSAYPTPLWLRAGETASFGQRTVDDFDVLLQVGLGAYGEVYKARDKRSNELVALKKVLVHDKEHGFPVAALREIRLMLALDHPNILTVKEVMPSITMTDDKDNKGVDYVVLPYYDNDLVGIISNKKMELSMEYVKCYMKQLLKAVYYLHVKKYMHRDIKTANILVDNHSRLVLADWGFAREWKSKRKFTNKVVTLWYRAPELLLGMTHYTTQVDLWPVGCIFFELLTGEALLPGANELNQLERIFKLCGTPTENSWPGFSQTPGFKLDFETHGNTMDSRFAKIMDPHAVDLLKRLLIPDPRQRITAEAALDHDFFFHNGVAKAPESLAMLSGDGKHEFELKQERERKRQAKAAETARKDATAAHGVGHSLRYHNDSDYYHSGSRHGSNQRGGYNTGYGYANINRGGYRNSGRSGGGGGGGDYSHDSMQGGGYRDSIYGGGRSNGHRSGNNHGHGQNHGYNNGGSGRHHSHGGGAHGNKSWHRSNQQK